MIAHRLLFFFLEACWSCQIHVFTYLRIYVFTRTDIFRPFLQITHVPFPNSILIFGVCATLQTGKCIKLKQPFTVNYLECNFSSYWFLRPTTCWLVMEFLADGSLMDEFIESRMYPSDLNERKSTAIKVCNFSAEQWGVLTILQITLAHILMDYG